MRGLEYISKKIIYINGKKFELEYAIGSVVIIPDKIFVCLDPSSYEQELKERSLHKESAREIIADMKLVNTSNISKDMVGDDLNRVYCYDYDGNMLWQMKPPKFKDFPEFGQYPINGIKYDRKENKLVAYDCGGRVFDLNLETGEPMSFKAERF